MSKNTAIIVTGALVLVTPYLGIPSDWKTVIFVAVGIIIIIIGLSLRRDGNGAGIQTGKKTDTFVENGAKPDTSIAIGDIRASRKDDDEAKREEQTSS